MTKKQRRAKHKPEFFVNMFKKTVAHNIQPHAETAMSHQLMRALAVKLQQYNYSPIVIAHEVVNTKSKRRTKSHDSQPVAA